MAKPVGSDAGADTAAGDSGVAAPDTGAGPAADAATSDSGPGASPVSDSGCGCDVPGRTSTNVTGILALAALGVVAARRRRV